MMKGSLRWLMVLALPLLLAGCKYHVTPDTNMRVYEKVSSEAMRSAVPKAFLQAGYITKDAKTDTKESSMTRNGVTEVAKTYEYGPAYFPENGRYDCMKLANLLYTPVPKDSVQLVELRSVDVTCYRAINKMDFGVDTDTATYERFFNALSNELGVEGKRVGVAR